LQDQRIKATSKRQSHGNHDAAEIGVAAGAPLSAPSGTHDDSTFVLYGALNGTDEQWKTFDISGRQNSPILLQIDRSPKISYGRLSSWAMTNSWGVTKQKRTPLFTIFATS
jgi:hypothetical protein